MHSDDVVSEIKGKLPIEEVVGSYIALKKNGRVYKALCPFHGEKTPSFTVNPERGIFKCFGCGEAGDIFAFVMKQEGITFPEALQLLAERGGVTLPERTDRPKGEPTKSRIASLNQYIATVWHKLLVSHPKAGLAREYLQMRGLSSESITNFSIGYAPTSTTTDEVLKRAGYSIQEQHAAGDPRKFADRIVFPITDITGRIVAFTGRLLVHPDDPPGSAARGPKYWNSPETPLFVKSRTLFALHLAKRNIEQVGHAILAEGQMDVILLHQAGYTQAVASSGTALTQEQLELIRRFAPAVVFAYDNDKAGQEATVKGVELALKLEITPYVVSMPSGMDPADLVLKDPALWEKAYSARTDHLTWRVHQLAPHGVAALPSETRRHIAKELVRWITLTPDPLERERAFPLVAAHLQAPESSVRELYDRLSHDTHGAHREQQSSTSLHRERPVKKEVESNPAIVASAILFLEPSARDTIGDALGATPSTANPLTDIIWAQGTTKALEHAISILDSDKRMELTLEAESIVSALYPDQELTETWVVSELLLLLHHHRSNSREAVKHRLAQEIQAAQVTGDVEKMQKLFAELHQLL